MLAIIDVFLSFFFVNDTATTDIYTYLHTLSLHDALPICSMGVWMFSAMTKARSSGEACSSSAGRTVPALFTRYSTSRSAASRSEEHTSELQSLMRNSYAVLCLKKKNIALHIDTQNESNKMNHKQHNTLDRLNNTHR